jgi:hypothetical protein
LYLMVAIAIFLYRFYQIGQVTTPFGSISVLFGG